MAHRQQTRTLPKAAALLCLLGAAAMVLFGLGAAALADRFAVGHMLASIFFTGGGVFLALWVLPEVLSQASSREKRQVTEPARVADDFSQSAIGRAVTTRELPRASAVVIQFPSGKK